MMTVRLPVPWILCAVVCFATAAAGPAQAQPGDAPAPAVVDTPASPSTEAASAADPPTEIVQHVVGPAPATVQEGPTWTDANHVERQRKRYRSMRIAGSVLLVIGLVTPPLVFVGMQASEDCSSGSDFCGFATVVGTLASVAGATPLIIAGGVTLGIGRRRGRDLELQAPRIGASRHGVSLYLGARF